MSALKKLAGQTAIYGLSSILGRVVNYLLVPLYTAVFTTSEFGEYTELYAYIAILLIILTMGLETAFFHFTQKYPEKKQVFSTALILVALFSSVFLFFTLISSDLLAQLTGYGGHSQWITYTAFIITLDALTAIPLAKLRIDNRPYAFAAINLFSIVVNVGLNLFVLIYCAGLAESIDPPSWVRLVYKPEMGIGYIFIINLIASLVRLLAVIPFISKNPLKYDAGLAQELVAYGFPLMISGLGFIINERLDVILLKYTLPGTENEVMMQVGIYAGCYKLAIFLSLFIQAYRFAAEPYFFNQSKSENIRKNYARAMNFFILICCVGFLTITLYLDIFKYFIQREEYYAGLKIVPIILFANIFLGIYVNLSMWYKLAGKTRFGVYFSLAGAFVTIAGNLLLIPYIGYMGSAWVTLIAYGLMMILSYYTGRKHYPIPYNLRKAFFYMGFALLLFGISWILPFENLLIKLFVNTLLFIPYLFAIFIIEPSIHRPVLKRLAHGNKNR